MSATPSLLEVVRALAGKVDEHLSRNGGRTDLGEMAQMAACEALTALGTPIFDSTHHAHLPVLNGLSRQPYLRRDGSLAMAAGYDAVTGHPHHLSGGR